MAHKVTVIGAGNVGATTAQRLVEKDVCDVILFDIVEGLAAGKALDLMQAAPIEGHSKKIQGTHEYGATADSDIVVITAGLPRKPGMSREDLLSMNGKIIKTICESIKKTSPNAIVVTVTNPLDIMTQYAYEILGYDKNRVMGMAGVLDSARMRYFLSLELNATPKDVDAVVLGGHGDLMVPVMSQVKLNGKPVTNLSNEVQESIIHRTQHGGAEIVQLLKTGSAYYAPGSSAAFMVEQILKDTKVILPACALLEGEYDQSGVYCGVPVKLGRSGIEEIVILDLSKKEKEMLQYSADTVKKGFDDLKSAIAKG